MTLVRLMTGALTEGGPAESEKPGVIERKARLVYTGKFDSIDGEVEIKPEHLEKIVLTHNSLIERLKRLMVGEVPLRFMPPVQVDHSRSGWDTVGRVVGPLTIENYTNDDGEIRPAIYGTVRILGQSNVDRVTDGRWTNLSIGADLESGKLTELTITPFPAAAEAAMLSEKKLTEGDSHMDMEGLKRHLKGYAHHMEGLGHHYGMGKSHSAHLADVEKIKDHDEAAGHLEAMKKHMEGMAKKHLEAKEAPPEEHEKMRKHHLEGLAYAMDGMKQHMTGQHHPHLDTMKHHLEGMKEHKLAASPPGEQPGEQGDKTPPPAQGKGEQPGESPKAKPTEDKGPGEEKKMAIDQSPGTEQPSAKMAALKEGLTKLSAMQNDIKLAQKKANLQVRLSQLKATCKITPAELKKIDLVELSKQNDATIEAVFKSYENREPVIIPGMQGSTSADDLAKVAKQSRLSRLENEVRENMPMKRAELERTMKLRAESPRKNFEQSDSRETDPARDENPLVNLASEVVEDSKKNLSLLAEQVEKMQNQIEDLLKLS